ncbi:MAG: hypothetical protein WHV66_06650 [Anaerolineales bacterium]
MSDLFIQFVTGWVLPKKADYSRQVALNAPKAALPVLGQAGSDGRVSMQTIEKVNQQCARLRYVADPLWGLVDFYNHPEYTQWQLVNNRWDQPCDCDDLAVYAHALFLKTGIRSDKVWIWNILVSPGYQISQAWANHVMCAVEYWDGSKIWTAIIDTNSAANGKAFFFYGDRFDAQMPVIQHFKQLYGVQYYALVKVDPPWQ